MKRIILLLMAVLMLSALFAGCGATKKADDLSSSDDKTTADDEVTTEESSDVSAETQPDNSKEAPADSVGASSGGTAAESYLAYLEAKNAVITKLTDGLSNSPDAGMAVLSFMGVAMIDLAILPASFFGQGQEAVQMGLAMMGATDVKYTENGNSYSVTYTDEEGKNYVFSGAYDKAADALVCTGSTDGKENIVSEYRKTSFGYVGQYYFLNDDDTTSIYMIAVEGEDGTVGISLNTNKPAALTGSESADFPKACAEWYSVKGTTITGKTSDGTDLNFEYTPTESASN